MPVDAAFLGDEMGMFVLISPCHSGPCACYWLLPCIFGIHDRQDPIEGSLENPFESLFTELPFYPDCRPFYCEGQCW